MGVRVKVKVRVWGVEIFGGEGKICGVFCWWVGEFCVSLQQDLGVRGPDGSDACESGGGNPENTAMKKGWCLESTGLC